MLCWLQVSSRLLVMWSWFWSAKHIGFKMSFHATVGPPWKRLDHICIYITQTTRHAAAKPRTDTSFAVFTSDWGHTNRPSSRNWVDNETPRMHVNNTKSLVQSKIWKRSPCKIDLPNSVPEALEAGDRDLLSILLEIARAWVRLDTLRLLSTIIIFFLIDQW